MMYNMVMIKLTITENEEKQRLDRFLKKYFRNAPLSYIYKMIRKDVKVNGKRVSMETQLALGDEVAVYISQQEADLYSAGNNPQTAKKQFHVAYEDDNIIIVEKPFGLLTHGTSDEKKNTLANQVIGYLIETGEYNPRGERIFVPSPVNRLDRNTTGLVIFGKNYAAVKSLNRMIRERGCIRKYYLTIVSGVLKKEIKLTDRMEKNTESNKIEVKEFDEGSGKVIETIARPIKSTDAYTLVEAELVTGRSHQIRAHLAKAGYPIIGDEKYGNSLINKKIRNKFNLTTQLLHAYRLSFDKTQAPVENLEGKEIICSLPDAFERIKSALFRENS